jgi:hypothetical protein
MTPEEESEFWERMSNRAWSQAMDLMEMSDRYWENHMKMLARKKQDS